MTRLIRTDVELFDLPEGAVIRTIGPAGNVGEVSEPRFNDLKPWEIDPNGEDRLIPRRVDWAGSDIPTYEYEHGEIARFLPAEVIWLPESASEAAL